ncbi:hypothetical protein F5884DRAFT_140344 [Xylogone sp. PMI_703]|nr:hypothetical protein F5884DRAFT_140344 [Xylogone sp. PMI_703]
MLLLKTSRLYFDYNPLKMPIITRDRRGKRARESSKEAEDHDIQLGGEASYTDLTLNPSTSTALSLLRPSSSHQERETPSTPPPQSALNRVPNIKYFHDQEIFVENLTDLVPPLSWELMPKTTMKWLSYDDPEEKYTDEHPHVKFGMILIRELNAFLNLKVAENHFSPEKPEFSLQLLVQESTLDILKDLLSRRGEGYTVNNPLKIKIPESELLSDSFKSGDLFPDGFDGTSTTDTDDGPALSASVWITSCHVLWEYTDRNDPRRGPFLHVINALKKTNKSRQFKLQCSIPWPHPTIHHLHQHLQNDSIGGGIT